MKFCFHEAAEIAVASVAEFASTVMPVVALLLAMFTAPLPSAALESIAVIDFTVLLATRYISP